MYEGVETLCGALCIVGESPVWMAEEKALYQVDIHGKRIRRIDWRSGQVQDYVMPQQAGALVPQRQGGLVACMEDGVYRIGPHGEMLGRVAELPKGYGPRFNDVKAGPDGALYGGTIHYGGEGAFFRVTPKGEVAMLFGHVGNANGLDWSLDRTLLYFIDTPTRRLDVFDFSPADGTLSNRRTVREFPSGEGNPDGMAMDAQGMLWVALWGGGRVVRIDPSTGCEVSQIRLPVSNVSCCAFAGDGLEDMVITTAAHNTNLREEPLAGATFRVRPGVPGKAVYRFG